jgi:hypothetical protein
MSVICNNGKSVKRPGERSQTKSRARGSGGNGRMHCTNAPGTGPSILGGTQIQRVLG